MNQNWRSLDDTVLTLGGVPFEPGASKVAVLGGGVMGPGIALTLAEVGFSVTLCEVSEPALAQALEATRRARAVMVDEGLRRGDDTDDVLALVSGRVGIDEAVSGADLVVEAVTEDPEIKRDVCATISRLSPPHAAVWSNTSALDVFALIGPELADRLVVAHWFAPPHIIPLVEVVGGDPRTDGLVDETVEVLRALGKVPIKLNRMIEGFVINRIQRIIGREVFHLLNSGIVDAENLDLAIRSSLAPRMQVLGLVQRYDFTGFDLVMHGARNASITDPPVEAIPKLVEEMVAEGHMGVKTGRGFYDYDGRPQLELQDERDRHLLRVVGALGDYVDGPRPVR